jgi:hypothetical protein
VNGTSSRAEIKQAIWERVEGLIKKES